MRQAAVENLNNDSFEKELFMDEKLEQQLYNKYPTLFRQKDLSAQETCMCWGITVGNGWYTIVEEACQKLQQLADESKVIIEFSQVKEKFAELRLYFEVKPINDLPPLFEIESIFEKAREIASQAERLSLLTCEICGEPGVFHPGGWVKVRCKKCLDK
jgi:hypothetical protein